MASRKVFFPIKDATLKGFLHDAHITLCGVSDVWAYREKITIQSGFVVAAHVLLMSAIKEIEIAGGITFDIEDVQAVTTKDIKDLSVELMLDILMTAATRKTISLQGALQISGDAEYTKRAWLDALQSNIRLGGSVKDSIMVRTTELAGGIQLVAELGDLTKEVGARCSSLLMRLKPEVDFELLKSAIPESSGMRISAVVTAVARRYRAIENLDGVSMADIQNWTLQTFYYMEV